MEFVITTERPFEEIETAARVALERHGFTVHRTFSLQSAIGLAGGREQPGYSVFLLHSSDSVRGPVGLLALYRRGIQTVISPMLSPVADADVEAELIGALVLGGLELCMDARGAEKCIDLAQSEEDV